MSIYDPTVNLGDERLRVFELIVANPLVGEDGIAIREELVGLLVDGEVKVATGRALSAGFAAGTTIDKRNPLTDEVIGTVTHEEIQIAGYSLARSMQLADDAERGVTNDYTDNTVQGETRRRVSNILISNRLGQTQTATCIEDEVMLFASGERVTEAGIRKLVEQFEAENVIDQRNPLTDEVIGSLTHADIQIAFYSLARSIQLADDERLAARGVGRPKNLGG